MVIVDAFMNIFYGRSDGLGQPRLRAVSVGTIHAIRRGIVDVPLPGCHGAVLAGRRFQLACAV
jgi:hypothetical protein